MNRTLTILSLVVFCNPCNAGGLSRNEQQNRDTTVLITKDTSLVTGAIFVVCPLSFPDDIDSKYDSSRRTWLLLDDPVLIVSPDGVYEIYLTTGWPDTGKLDSRNPAFVNILDLYTLTAPGTRDYLAVEIGPHMRRIYQSKQGSQSFYFSLIFRGAIHPGGLVSTGSGELRIAGVRVVQTGR